MDIAALILGVMKLVPIFENIFLKCIDLFYAQKAASERNDNAANTRKVESVIAALKAEGLTDEQRNELRHVLFDLSKR